MSTAPITIELRMVAGKETANNVVFEESLPVNGGAAIVGPFYVRKSTLEALGNPEVIHVWIKNAGEVER